MADYKGMQGHRVEGAILDEVFGGAAGSEKSIPKVEASWEVFKACTKCLADKGKPCRFVRWSKRTINGRRKAVRILGKTLTNPHRGRKKVNARPLGYRITW